MTVSDRPVGLAKREPNAGVGAATAELVTDNRVRLLHALRRDPGLSKTDLTQQLRLGSGTVSVLISDLAAAELVVSLGFAASTGGRRPQRLALNAEKPLMLGVDLGETDARFGVLNLEGRLIRVDHAPLQRAGGIVELAPVIDKIRATVAETPGLAGIGIAVPGRIATDTRRVIRASNLGWRSMQLREPVEDATGLPTVVERNTTAALVGEEWWGSAPAGDPFVFVTAGSGIGAAVKIHGRVVHGASDAAGEFGHIPAVWGGRRCRCGARGCLETEASVPALLANYARTLRSHGRPYPTGRQETIAALAAASADDPLAAKVIRNGARHLGLGLSTLVSLLNPQVIVIGGELMDVEELIMPDVDAALKARGPDAPGAGVQIVRSTFLDQASLIGAATIAFDALLPTLARA